MTQTRTWKCPFSIARSESVVKSEVTLSIENAIELFSSDNLVNSITDTVGEAVLQSFIDRLQRRARLLCDAVSHYRNLVPLL